MIHLRKKIILILITIYAVYLKDCSIPPEQNVIKLLAKSEPIKLVELNMASEHGSRIVNLTHSRLLWL